MRASGRSPLHSKFCTNILGQISREPGQLGRPTCLQRSAAVATPGRRQRRNLPRRSHEILTRKARISGPFCFWLRTSVAKNIALKKFCDDAPRKPDAASSHLWKRNRRCRVRSRPFGRPGFSRVASCLDAGRWAVAVMTAGLSTDDGVVQTREAGLRAGEAGRRRHCSSPAFFLEPRRCHLVAIYISGGALGSGFRCAAPE